MKFLFDLFPAIIFFGTFKYAEQHREQAALWVGQLLGPVTTTQAPILFATITVIVATLIQIIWVALRHGKVSKMLWISLALVTVFGSMTLIFQNETFIKWKPTVLYWVMAGGMLGATLFKRNAIHLMFKDKVNAPPEVWSRVNLAFVLFLVFMGILNLFVAYRYTTEAWMNFKLFGSTGLLFVFMMGLAAYLSKHIKEDES